MGRVHLSFSYKNETTNTHFAILCSIRYSQYSQISSNRGSPSSQFLTIPEDEGSHESRGLTKCYVTHFVINII